MSFFHPLTLLLSLLALHVYAQSTTTSSPTGPPVTGYYNYSIEHSGDPDSAIYGTAGTPTNVSQWPAPDVFLNASVHVDEISIIVDDISAKINLDAEVLNLLKFNAGVDASIDRVSLIIKDVNAEVMLEARLENLVLMVEDILQSLDLNPVLVTLGQGIQKVVNNTVGVLSSPAPGAVSAAVASKIARRDYQLDLENNILYSVNDYSGHVHTNRVLAQDGTLVDETLNDMGQKQTSAVVGTYKKDMKFAGHTKEVLVAGETLTEKEYTYAPFPGLVVYCMLYFDGADNVKGAQVIGEVSGGASSTINDDDN